MTRLEIMARRTSAYTVLLMLGLAGTAHGTDQPTDAPRQTAQARIDGSGRILKGHATVFAGDLIGQRMADGGRFDPEASIAASSTLPLGTTARVTNLRNGRIAMVRIRDRMPDANGRILSVSPKVAEVLGVRRAGMFPVTVSPLAVPQSDGSVRLGAGTGLAGRRAYVTGADRR
jgi:rare lipoprotein A